MPIDDICVIKGAERSIFCMAILLLSNCLNSFGNALLQFLQNVCWNIVPCILKDFPHLFMWLWMFFVFFRSKWSQIASMIFKSGLCGVCQMVWHGGLKFVCIFLHSLFHQFQRNHQLHQLKYNPKFLSILHRVLVLAVNRVLVPLLHFFFVRTGVACFQKLELWLVTSQHLLPLVRIPVVVFPRILQAFGLLSFS